jgi:hypothetical protein
MNGRVVYVFTLSYLLRANLRVLNDQSNWDAADSF